MILSVGYGGYEVEYVAILSRAIALGIPLPADADKYKQNSFLKRLKDLGIFSQLDSLLVWKNAGTKEFATIDWIVPTRQCTYSPTGLTHNNISGIFSDGVNGYIDTGHSRPNNSRTTSASTFGYASNIAIINGSNFNAFWGGFNVNVEGFIYNWAGSNRTSPSVNTNLNSVTYLGQKLSNGLSLCQKPGGGVGCKLIQNGTDYGLLAMPDWGYNGVVNQYIFRISVGASFSGVSANLILWGAGGPLLGYEAALKTATDNFSTL
jgi:hypothetical protein